MLERLQVVEKVDKDDFKQQLGKQMNHVSQSKHRCPDDLFRFAFFEVLTLKNGWLLNYWYQPENSYRCDFEFAVELLIFIGGTRRDILRGGVVTSYSTYVLCPLSNQLLPFDSIRALTTWYLALNWVATIAKIIEGKQRSRIWSQMSSLCHWQKRRYLHTPESRVAHGSEQVETNLTATGLSGDTLKIIEFIAIDTLANGGTGQ